MKKPKYMKAPPAWMVVGASVDYSATIGQPPTILNARITREPFEMPGSTGQPARWATFIDKVRGWVAIEALRQAS
jgi:hypothetical protein